MAVVVRHYRVWIALVRANLLRELQYPVNFVGKFLIEVAALSTGLAFFAVVYNRGGVLGGWTFRQAIFFQGTLAIWSAINGGLYFSGILQLPQRILEGELDYVLAKPVHSLFYSALRSFDLGFLANLVVAVAIVAATWSGVGLPPGPGVVLQYVGLLVAGQVVTFALLTITTSSAFWLTQATGPFSLYREFIYFAKVPDTIYPGWARTVLTVIVPVTLAISVPSRAVFGTLGGGETLLAIVVAAAFLLLTLQVWRLAIRRYESASS